MIPLAFKPGFSDTRALALYHCINHFLFPGSRGWEGIPTGGGQDLKLKWSLGPTSSPFEGHLSAFHSSSYTHHSLAPTHGLPCLSHLAQWECLGYAGHILMPTSGLICNRASAQGHGMFSFRWHARMPGWGCAWVLKSSPCSATESCASVCLETPFSN